MAKQYIFTFEENDYDCCEQIIESSNDLLDFEKFCKKHHEKNLVSGWYRIIDTDTLSIVKSLFVKEKEKPMTLGQTYIREWIWEDRTL